MAAHSRSARLGSRFRGLWAATAASSLGDGLVLVGFPLLVVSLTRNPVVIAGVAAADQLPAFVLAPVAGAVADRLDRRRVALTVEIVRLAAFAAFAAAVLTGRDSIALIYCTVGFLGTCDIAFKACTVAALPAIVDARHLEDANGKLGAADLTARELAGQGLGGLVFALARSLPFVLDALSFALSAVLLRRCLPPTEGRPAATTIRADIAEGFRWFASHRQLRSVAMLLGTYAFAQTAVMAVFVLYASGPLHAGRVGYGLLLAVGSLGAVGGSLAAGRIARLLGPAGAISGAGLVAAGAYLLLAAHASVVAAGAALALESASVSVGNVASLSLRQRLIPDDLLGRVGVTFRMVLIGAGVVGAVAGGVAAGTVGLRTGIALAGALQLAVVAASALLPGQRGGAHHRRRHIGPAGRDPVIDLREHGGTIAERPAAEAY